MANHLLLALTLLLFLPSSHCLSTIATVTTTPSLSFIESSCMRVEYPRSCIASLRPLATTIHPDPIHLAIAALNVTIECASSTTAMIKGMPRSPATQDCIEVMADAVDELRKSLKVMMHIGGQELGDQIDDMQTWVSAALTNENTCLEGFEETRHGSWETPRGSIVQVAQLTSNALGFINVLIKPQSSSPFV